MHLSPSRVSVQIFRGGNWCCFFNFVGLIVKHMMALKESGERFESLSLNPDDQSGLVARRLGSVQSTRPGICCVRLWIWTNVWLCVFAEHEPGRHRGWLNRGLLVFMMTTSKQYYTNRNVTRCTINRTARVWWTAAWPRDAKSPNWITKPPLKLAITYKYTHGQW